MPRIMNFQRADQHAGKVVLARPGGIEVDVDLAWDTGYTETRRCRMDAWTEVGDGDERRLTGCHVVVTRGGYTWLTWMPPSAVRRAEGTSPSRR